MNPNLPCSLSKNTFPMHISGFPAHSNHENMLGGIMMPNLNQLELQNLRHMIGGHGTLANKLDDYAKQCTDPAIVALLQKDAQDARNTKQTLMSFLN